MNNKLITMILAVLFIISTVCGTLGYVNKDKTPDTPVTPEPIKEETTYEFYLEEQLVAEMPTNTEEEKYEFSKSLCDNNMQLTFDNESWTYIVDQEKTGVCRLYFVKAQYDVTLTVTNGLINGTDASNVFKVDRLTDGQFNIIPNEGYEYTKNATCSNDKEALFDKSTNTLTITSVSEDVACKIDFEKRSLKVDINVQNGKGTTSEFKEYGETFTAVVQPDDGFEKAKIECSNKQEFTYADNKLTIQKLTNDTVCNVTFLKAPAVTYNLQINDLPEQVIITAGNTLQTIIAGKDGKFSIKVEEGYDVNLDCGGIKPSDVLVEPDGVITYTFLGVSSNITCQLTVTPKENTEPTD